MKGRKCRIAMYSPGMVGFGHIRRNASIAQALRCSSLQPVIMMIAEARQAGALPMPEGVDFVTLPALRKEADGCCRPRYLDVTNQELIDLRSKVISRAIKAFEPDVLIVDHLPIGAAGELVRTLERARRHGNMLCVLGLRDVLQDPASVRDSWSDRTVEALEDFYDAIWIYGDPAVYDPVREYGLFDQVAGRVHYTGYLDQRPRLAYARAQAAQELAALPRGKLAICVVGGGQDGAALAGAFVQADLPSDTTGVLVTGPFMPAETRQRLRRFATARSGFRLLEFVPEPAALIHRAQRVIAMGGYNTMCEVLSFEKHALIVPRVSPKPEQLIRAERMRDLGLIDMLHPDALNPQALTRWLARDLGPPAACRSLIDFGGLTCIPRLLADELEVFAESIGQDITTAVS